MEHFLTEGQFFLIDKPMGWTSFDVVNLMRNFAKRELGIPKLKIGHAGTLDPLATGLLIICTGSFTKKIDQFQDMEKEYTGTFCIGQTTPSYDLEKEPDTDYPTDHITPALLQQAALGLTGDISQVPPIFSAIKMGGKRLYKFARKKVDVEIQPRMVSIKTFELTGIAMPLVDFRVICSKGTYIRALARDFGLAVNSGAYLYSLRRTAIGEFTVKQALTVDSWKENMKKRTSGLPEI
ncbi:MAG: tRNA pseudouridine(55) synthase TruB [Bacteroidetes bacterium]|nr:tRNA pseudouridine(55) synthase TruB [Bacteroidota bacterium]